MKKISHYLLSIVIVCIGGITGCNQVSSIPETSAVGVSSSTEIVYELLDSEIVNGDVYTYDISTYGDEQEYTTEIIVKQGMREVSDILIENGEWGENSPRVSYIILEKDVNFDGNMDVLINLGQFGEEKDLRYKCYLWKKLGLEYCKGFEEIYNAEVFGEIPMIVGYQRNGENVTFERYEIVDNEIQVTDSFTTQTDDEYIFYDQIFYELMFHREQPDVVTAYEYIIETYEKVYPGACSYNLVFFDEDEIQELVVEMDGCFVSLYTYHVGEIYPLMNQWTYGVGGNYGYEYIEKEGIVRNFDSDNGGDIRRITFWELTGERQLAQKYSLVDTCEDLNGNAMEEAGDGEGKRNYYCNNNDAQNVEIPQEEFEEYLRDGQCVFFARKIFSRRNVDGISIGTVDIIGITVRTLR